ncbi:MAG TPA: hypothetical protein VFM02_02615 [Candidatus Paceibacterota bacterium]|nr:hypothetical protein [Candidatus Paceibacterota bacterium]
MNSEKRFTVKMNISRLSPQSLKNFPEELLKMGGETSYYFPIAKGIITANLEKLSSEIFNDLFQRGLA